MNKNMIVSELEKKYRGSKSGLIFSNSFELLIATILSAQTNDNQVNKVTAELFKELKTPEQYLKLSEAEFKEKIKSIGLNNSKSRHILQTCKLLVEEHLSRVPKSFEELVKLPGVGRKTANVVLSNAFGIPALAVDTHVFRVSNRLGLVEAKNVEDTENQLKEIIPQEKWSDAHHWLIWHGRKICTAAKPKCGICFLSNLCPSNKEA